MSAQPAGRSETGAPEGQAGIDAGDRFRDQLLDVVDFVRICCIAAIRCRGQLSRESLELIKRLDQPLVLVGELVGQPGLPDRDQTLGSDRVVEFEILVANVRIFLCVKHVHRAGKISVNSPIARALIGRTEGDTTEVRAPGGVRAYEIVSVDYR